MVVSLRASFSDRVRDGFTLLELLAAITVIAILVTLISVGVSKAKKASRSLACKNNLRQQGIWLTEFVSDNGAYPLGSNTNTVRYPNHAASFQGTLRRVGGFGDVVQEGDGGDVFDCPTGSPPSDLQFGEGFIDYGYNSDGIMGRIGDTSLGLGGLGTEDGDLFAPPVSTAAVVNPSEMIATGDAFLGWKGLIMNGRNAYIGLRAGTSPRPRETAQAFQRHSKFANYLLCDGHVDQLKLEALFLNPELGSARYWNRDNSVHPERLWK
jgi:prepilin-type N-terminal cleavage/methylation domain-containing protein/prepilin-type processing-associated H-X9-DG protein